MLKIGVQVSIAGKIYKSVERAVSLGCTAMQIFSRNPRSFKRKILTADDIDIFRRARKNAGLSPLVIHAVYTQNLAASDDKFHRRSVESLIKDLKDAAALDADFMVVHPGSFKGSTYDKGIKKVVYALGEILKTAGSNLTVLLENVSGSGSWLGSRFSELAFIIDKVGCPENLGICFDTCHAFSAGYDIRQDEGLRNLISEIDSSIGADKVKLVHLNDTRDSLGSHKDRHYHIGQGQIGLEGFKRLINHPKFKDKPFILETPKKNDNDDIMNLEVVKELYNN